MPGPKCIRASPQSSVFHVFLLPHPVARPSLRWVSSSGESLGDVPELSPCLPAFELRISRGRKSRQHVERNLYLLYAARDAACHR